MSKKQIPFEQLTVDEDGLYKALHLDSDVICVVTGAAFLDAVFDSLLRKNMMTSKVTDKLLSGALSDFRARADLLYCLSLIPKEPYQDAVTIAEIRNRFSHSHLKLGFEDATIIKLCNQLKGWSYFSKDDTSARSQFIKSIVRLVRPLMNILEITPAFAPQTSLLTRFYPGNSKDRP